MPKIHVSLDKNDFFPGGQNANYLIARLDKELRHLAIIWAWYNGWTQNHCMRKKKHFTDCKITLYWLVTSYTVAFFKTLLVPAWMMILSDVNGSFSSVSLKVRKLTKRPIVAPRKHTLCRLGISDTYLGRESPVSKTDPAASIFFMSQGLMILEPGPA